MDEQKKAKVSLDDIFSRIQEGEMKDLNIVVKADVQGTIQALEQALTNIKNTEVKVVIVHSGVGTINESDVMLASASNALIIGFNVRPDANARKAAETEQVDIRTYRVIYDALNDVEAAIKGMLAPKFRERSLAMLKSVRLFPSTRTLLPVLMSRTGRLRETPRFALSATESLSMKVNLIPCAASKMMSRKLRPAMNAVSPLPTIAISRKATSSKSTSWKKSQLTKEKYYVKITG